MEPRLTLQHCLGSNAHMHCRALVAHACSARALGPCLPARGGRATTSLASASPSHVSEPPTRERGLHPALYSWPGLDTWRASPPDERRVWGEKVAVEGEPSERSGRRLELPPMEDSLAACALQVLRTPDPRVKAELSHRAYTAFSGGLLPVGRAAGGVDRPARPEVPALVPPKAIPPPKASPLPLNAYMLHNLAHIELNAIDLAWDTVARFSALGLPDAFYGDFARVADDEGRHLGWCLQRLDELGYKYGDMDAHDLLWEGCSLSGSDLGARLVVVPMSQEARGLDAGPRLVQRLVGKGDNRSAAIVNQISEEEKAHVAVGVTWFRMMCAATGMDPGPAFRGWLADLAPDLLKGPFNDASRVEVGLEPDWYDVATWPADMATGVDPVAAAARKGAGESLSTGEPQAYRWSTRLTEGQLAGLRERLRRLIDVEAANAGVQ